MQPALKPLCVWPLLLHPPSSFCKLTSWTPCDALPLDIGTNKQGFWFSTSSFTLLTFVQLWPSMSVWSILINVLCRPSSSQRLTLELGPLKCVCVNEYVYVYECVCARMSANKCVVSYTLDGKQVFYCLLVLRHFLSLYRPSWSWIYDPPASTSQALRSQACLSYGFYCCSETLWPKGRLGRKVFIWLPLLHHSPSLEEARTGTWRQKLMQRPWRSAYSWLCSTCFLMHPRTTYPEVTPLTRARPFHINH